MSPLLDPTRVGEYKPGSILRVKMVNFLTYKEVEVCPGPRLNVVCGPNGSGKSTILCALCLGLGGQPNLLGRADDVKLFIMHEEDSAEIEIELAPKDPTQPHHDIIKRHIIRAKGRSNAGASDWYVNDEKSSHKEVKELVRGYGVQVDNLCTFLPQDRVGSFSGFTAQSLLVETQKALDGDLYGDQQKLIELESQVGQSDRTVQTTEQKLEQLQKERERLEKEKERMEEREACMQRIELLEKKNLWLTFDERRARAIDLKREKDTKKAELKEVMRRLAPLEQRDQFLQNECNQFKNRINQKEQEIRAENVKKDKLMRKIDSCDDEITTIAADIENIETVQRKALRRAEMQQQKVEECERVLNDLPTMEKLDAQHREASAALKQAKRDHDLIKRDYMVQHRNMQDLQEKIGIENRKFQKMNDDKARRREAIFQRDQNLAATYEWVDANRKLFRRPIFGPIAIEVTTKSQNTAAYLEQHVPSNTLRAYVVECKEDYDLLYREVRQKMNLPVNIQLVSRSTQPVHRIYSNGRMTLMKEKHGVIGYLDEAFDAPGPVMEALKASANVHAVLVGSSRTQESIDRHGLLNLLSSAKEGSSQATSYCIISAMNDKSYKYTGQVSRYSGKINTRVDEISAARMLAPGVSEERKNAVKESIAKLEAEYEQNRPIHENLKEKFEAALEVGKQRNKCVEDVKRRKNQVSNAKIKLETAQRKLDDDIANAQKDKSAEKKRNQKKLKKCIVNYTSTLKVISETQERIMRLTFAKAGMTVKDNVISERVARENAQLVKERAVAQALQQKLEEIMHGMNQIRSELRNLKEQAEQHAPLYDSSGQELPLKEQLEELPESVEEVGAAIEECRTKMQGMENNPGVLQEYGRILRAIEAAEAERDKVANGVSNNKTKLERLLHTWKSRLENTIKEVDSKFSKYMQDLNCAGEVVLAGSDNAENGTYNFKNWGVEIRVRFRQAGTLQVLSAQRHSGGERSVSTIMYMMALQELMSSPFRCVDEINQGLDERNERLVFKRIVQNSTLAPGAVTNDHSGQYFLITPKLLPNLEGMDNPRLTALVVYNGPYNFKDCRDWNVPKLVERAESKKRNVELESADGETDEAEEEESEVEVPAPRKKKNKSRP
mmetsp:Transcript_29269/g.45481  ORF Transcript_29269/g.45481 Transcript_29269/m.45481 type:complete len:1125 (+) Transcript_29269:51-3425(+)